MAVEMEQAVIPRVGGDSLVYVKATGGHRQSYLDTFSRLFGLAPVSGPIGPALLRRFVAADRLLFATLDENMLGFPAVAAMRSRLGRPTVGLFLRPQTCFQAGRWYYPVKRRAFRLLRRLPGLTIATITPFDVAPHYAEVAHVGVADPQYWDLHGDDGPPRPGRTALSDDVVARAAGRRILCLVGGLSSVKGLSFLADALERHPRIADGVLVVGGGRVRPQDTDITGRLEAAGAIIVDRFISDAELDSLYGIADLIWSCYAPGYDQASGIFGRAVQYGVPPIVREGSLIAAFAAANGVDHISVLYEDCETLSNLLLQPRLQERTVSDMSVTDRRQLITSWQRFFQMEITKGLVGDKAPS
jgi:hypothetical protein